MRVELTGDRRAALLLRLQGAKYDEIARRLGTNEKTVATWLHRSTRELVGHVRARMNEPGPVPSPTLRGVTTVSRPDMPADSLDRLLAGELSRSEERRLAQAALDDPELFDALTAAAIARAGLASADVANDAAKSPAAFSDFQSTGRSAWMPTALVTGLAAAAVFVLVVASGWKSGSPAPSRPAASSDSTPAAVLAAPILLSAHVETAATPTFRSGEAPSGRSPRQAGTILQVRDGTADVDLGSLDGLSEGMALPVVRGSRRVDHLTVTAVFRERARGRIAAHAFAQPGDRVEIDRATHSQALLQQVAARRAAGDLSAASRLASLAVSTANDQSVPADIRRRSLAELATIERRRGKLDDAMRLLHEAVRSFDSTPAAGPAERVDVLNSSRSSRLRSATLTPQSGRCSRRRNWPPPARPRCA